MRLKNKRAIITGGSSGIGQAIAIAFAKEGADIVIAYQSNTSGAEHTQKEIQKLGRMCYIMIVDLSDQQALNLFIAKSCSLLGGIDILVNNAGTLTRCKNFLSISKEDMDLVDNINYRAPFILMQLVAEHMKTEHHGGSIINISSVSTELVAPGMAHYESSKAALNMLTKSAASELSEHGIRVNAISPGLVATNINLNQRESDKELWEKRCAKIPLKRAGSPSDIVPFAILLASDEAKWTTGAIIHVDGGMMVNSHFKYGK
jgi:glucose 1-dehydrogenase